MLSFLTLSIKGLEYGVDFLIAPYYIFATFSFVKGQQSGFLLTLDCPYNIFRIMGFAEELSDAVFFLRTGSTPQIVERARIVVTQNNILLQGWLNQGLLTPERLEEIKKDPELQQRYKKMMKSSRDGGIKAEQAFQDLTNSPVDEQAGWFVYFRRFYERRFGVPLLREKNTS